MNDATHPPHPDPISRELVFVLGHPRSGFSPQSRKLLSYLARPTQSGGFDQAAIAADVLGRKADFQPDIDPLVRVAISRLRKSLGAFYDRFGGHRSFRLAIPQGKYCIVSMANDPFLMRDSMPAETTPAFGWTVTTDAAPEARAMGHRIDRVLSARIVETSLVHDGALRADRIPAVSFDSALDQAERAGSACLARIHVGALCERISLGLHCPANRHAAKVDDLGTHQHGLDVDRLVQRLIVRLADPLQSSVPRRLARAFPNSRLALAMRFFRFIATQDRTLLPECLDALEGAVGSRLSSPLIQALRIDAIRANYTFATGAGPDLSDDLLAAACRVLDCDPYQVYATLAHAYAAIAVDARDLPDVTGPGDQAVLWDGSMREDRDLYLTLTALRRDALPDLAVGRSSSFVGDVSRILSAMLHEDHATAAHAAFASRQTENFWTRILQCSVAVDLGQQPRAQRIFARLKTEVPQVEDFAGRAVVTMIPNCDLRSRIFHNLTQLS